MSQLTERFDVILSSTPATDLPHDTRANEITQLPTYLSVEHVYEEGTSRILTDSTFEGANPSLIQFVRDALGNITAIKSYVSGAWKTWKLDSGNLIMIPDNVTILVGDADETTGQKLLSAYPRVDGTTILYEKDADGNEQLTVPGITDIWQGFIKLTETFAVPVTTANASMTPLLLTESIMFGSSLALASDASAIEVTAPGIYSVSFSILGNSSVSPTETAYWARIERLAYGDAGYVTTGAYSLASLLGTAAGNSMWGLTSTTSVYVPAAAPTSPAKIRLSFSAVTVRGTGTYDILFDTGSAGGLDASWYNNVTITRLGGIPA